MIIEALRTNPKLNIYKAAETYDMPRTMLYNIIKSTEPMTEHQLKTQLLDKLKEEVFVMAESIGK